MVSPTEYDKEVGARIKQLRLSAGATQKAFADSLGIVQGFLSALETGKKVPSDTLVLALCQLYRIDRNWLCTGRGKMQAAAPAAESATGGIPLLSKISSDFPVIHPAEIESYLSLPDLPAGCYAIRFEGDFMAPTIMDGDLVVFQAGEDVGNKDIVLVTNRWGEVILRRYRVRGDEIYLAAENSSYSPFRPDPQTRTIGKVVAIWRRVKI
ncbi:MAG: Cro/Cl family transcriptional regulator [Desulfuromonadaceae bacterium GWC2_58_13]|nr:MAG: Cro/Cl family transcriptional regulator [Desulfuromonadaceae bacterium GWC2_58_13]